MLLKLFCFNFILPWQTHMTQSYRHKTVLHREAATQTAISWKPALAPKPSFRSFIGDLKKSFICFFQFLLRKKQVYYCGLMGERHYHSFVGRDNVPPFYQSFSVREPWILSVPKYPFVLFWYTSLNCMKSQVVWNNGRNLDKDVLQRPWFISLDLLKLKFSFMCIFRSLSSDHDI